MLNLERATPQKSTIETAKKEGIAFANIELSPEEQRAVDEVRIEIAHDDFDYYGRSNAELNDTLHIHLGQIGTNKKETLITISRLVSRVVEGFKSDLQKSSAWITVRTFLPSNDFDEPRWHSDGHYVKDENGEFVSEEYKLVFAIKGAPTRFQNVEVRPGQAVLYRVGEQGKNVHSEPQITEPRIFMSVVLGSETQIAELKTRFE